LLKCLRLQELLVKAKKTVASTLLLALALAGCAQNSAESSSLPDVGHIHHIAVDQGDILVGAHYGLFRYTTDSQWQRMGEEFDVMGLSVTPSGIVVSGHPGRGFPFPDPLGLLASNDGGETWQSVSLTGEVDFHYLTSSGNTLVGFDATNGLMVTSADGGLTWDILSLPPISAIALHPDDATRMVVISDGQGLVSADSGETFQEFDLPPGTETLVWSDTGLLAAAALELHLAPAPGEAFTLLATFDGVVHTVAASGNTIAVALHDDRVVASRDGGATFSVISD
jgi:hypothetical protein